MAYPRRLLNDHETVVVDLHPHWWCLVKPMALLIAAMAASIVVLLQTDARTLPRTALGWACLGLIVAAACWLVARSLRWVTTNFVITTQRVIDRSGVLSKHSTEIPLERVNTVMSSQGILERLFGVGDLVIESGGEVGQQRFEDIRNPNRVKSCCTGSCTNASTRPTSARMERRRATWRTNSRSSKACSTRLAHAGRVRRPEAAPARTL